MTTLSSLGGARAAAQGVEPARPDTMLRAELDSLKARLARAEAAIALARQHAATESQSAVRTRSRTALELSAQVLMNGYWSAGEVNSTELPSFLTPGNAGTATPFAAPRALGLSLRQTRIGVGVGVDSVLGGSFTGELDVDFFGGGVAAPSDAYPSPEPRLRSAWMQLAWPRTEVLVGSVSPLVSGLDPISTATVGNPGFGASGNLWAWLPQVRVTQVLGTQALGEGTLEWAVQGALLHPTSDERGIGEAQNVPAAERSGRPFVQGRLRLRWSDGSTDGSAWRGVHGEAGVGVHRGWLRLAGDSLTASDALTLDVRTSLGGGWEVRGEAYSGRGTEGLGGGGIEQLLGRPAPGAAQGVLVRDDGAWLQLNYRPGPTWVVGAGCGVNRVDDADRPDRTRNTTCAAHAQWRPAQPLRLGLEVRQLRTIEGGVERRGHHVNLAIGFDL